MARFHQVPQRNCWIAKVYDPTLKRDRSKTFGKGVGPREAAKLAPAVIADLQAAAEDAALDRGTVREYANKWLARRRGHLSPTTVAGGYEVIVKRIVKQFGRKPINELTRAEIRDWYDALRSQTKPKLSETTIERHHQVLRAILYQAVDDEVLVRNPAAKLKRPQKQPTKLQIPTDVAVERAMVELDGDAGRFFRLLLLTGARRGEMLGMTWSDVRPGPKLDGEHTAILNIERALIEAKGQVTVGPTKSKRTREVLVGEEAIAVIEEQRRSVLEQLGVGGALHPAGPLFPDVKKDRRGLTPHRPGWASEWWRNRRDEIGMPNLRLHSLRHYHVTWLLAHGVPLKDVSERVGHSLTSTTHDIYQHATTKGQEAAVRATRAIGRGTTVVR